jgi:ATP synthase protein I
MDDLDAQLRAVTRFTLFGMSACLLAWALFPGLRPYAAGLAIGMAVSLINMRYLGMKIKQMTILVMSNESKRFNLGFLTRAAMAVLTVLIAKELDGVNVYAAIAGLFFSQFASAAVGVASLLKK